MATIARHSRGDARIQALCLAGWLAHTIGNGPDAMHRVSMVGNDLALDTGIGMCGKAGQGVPVGVGQPHLRMDRMTVGGTESA